MGNNKVNIKSDIKEKIQKDFKVKADAVEACQKSYNKIIGHVPYEYLAHLVRTMEIFVRDQEHKEYFRITLTPNQSVESIKDLAWGIYMGDSYDIFYDDSVDDVQKRIAIAHELGHLFYDVITARDKDKIKDRETASTLFGIAAMLHKYQCKNDTPHYRSEEEILAQFKLLNEHRNR
ncbi:MAG: hypothetical protein KBT02_00165 [Treponema sp.]|nr:hypothetical protein [Candidatus Treponema caballi]